jgi:hypothetical protein
MKRRDVFFVSRFSNQANKTEEDEIAQGLYGLHKNMKYKENFFIQFDLMCWKMILFNLFV